MKRIAARIARLEVKLFPAPPYVMPDHLRQTVDRIIERIERLSGAPATYESIGKYFRSRSPDEASP